MLKFKLLHLYSYNSTVLVTEFDNVGCEKNTAAMLVPRGSVRYTLGCLLNPQPAEI